MKRIYTHIPEGEHINKTIPLVIMQEVLLSPIYMFIAWIKKLPGLSFLLKSYEIGTRLLFTRHLRFDLKEIYKFTFRSIDSVRYLEFSRASAEISRDAPYGAYLDVSSPRLLPIFLLSKNIADKFVFVNPDRDDLATTRRIISALDLDTKCEFYDSRIEDLTLESMSFDAITSISVLEHISNEQDALGKLWELLKPNGVLILSVPCASESFEEYIDFDEYGLGVKDEDGFFFGQRFYDDGLLEERLFRIVGEPTSRTVFGECQSGLFFENRKQKARLWMKYSHWVEPYMMSKEWKEFRSISDLPGVGVIILKFVKHMGGNHKEVR